MARRGSGAPYAWLVFVLFCVLVFLFGVFPGGWSEEAVDRHDTLLMSTFAAGTAVFGLAITLTAYRRGGALGLARGLVLAHLLRRARVRVLRRGLLFAALAIAAITSTRESGSSRASRA